MTHILDLGDYGENDGLMWILMVDGSAVHMTDLYDSDGEITSYEISPILPLNEGDIITIALISKTSKEPAFVSNLIEFSLKAV